jgi:peroxiredoxin
VLLAFAAGCAAESPGPVPQVACPPVGATGTDVGDPAADVALADCAGAPTALSELCGQPALVVSWYGWCPSCSTNADLAADLADEHADLAVVVALLEDPLGAPADADLCTEYAATWPSAAAIWTDAAHGLERYGTQDLVVVLDRAGTIAFRRETATEQAIVDAVEEVL